MQLTQIGPIGPPLSIKQLCVSTALKKKCSELAQLIPFHAILQASNL